MFTRVGVWILLAAFLLLPLYELSDYSEVWQHDGDLILPGLFFLFSGMALLARRFVYVFFRSIMAFLRPECGREKPSSLPRIHYVLSWSPPGQRLGFTFCDLRI